MAVMARDARHPRPGRGGLPRARRRSATSTCVYSAHDLHAWPELFFSGSGWVRFEPTPPGRASGVPDYTTQAVTIGDEHRHAAASATDRRVTSRPASPTRPSRRTSPEDQAGRPVRRRRLPLGLVAGGVVVLVVVARGRARPADAAPAPPRPARPARPRGGLGRAAGHRARPRLPWPQQRSPWQTREALVQLFGAPRDEFTPERPRRGPDTNPDAVFALDRIVHSLERLRYARADGSEAGTWRAEMQTCVEALYGGAPKRARRAADWWPRSVFVRRVDVRRPLDDGPGRAGDGGTRRRPRRLSRPLPGAAATPR